VGYQRLPPLGFGRDHLTLKIVATLRPHFYRILFPLSGYGNCVYIALFDLVYSGHISCIDRAGILKICQVILYV